MGRGAESRRRTDVEGDSVSTTEPVSHERTTDGTDKGPSGQDGRDERVGAGREIVCAIGLQISKGLDEVRHLFAPGDVSSVW